MIYRQYSNAVVYIKADEMTGTGFILKDGNIVTNWHIIRGYKKVAVYLKSDLERENYSGEFLVRGGKKITTEGKESPRTVVIEFPSFEVAEKFFYSDEYQEAHSILQGKVIRHHQIIQGS